MHEEEIKWTPQWFRYTKVGFFVMAILLAGITTLAKNIVPFYFMCYFLLLFIISFFLEIKKADVKYDSEKIEFKWLLTDEMISLSDVKNIYWHTRRTFKIYVRNDEIRMFLYFELNDRYWILSDVLDENDLNACVEGKGDNIPLMRIYKFYETQYPQKAGGLRTENDKW